VAVKVNRSNRAYYRCDHCGVKHEHTWQKASDAYVQTIGAAPAALAPSPQAAPEPETKPSKAAKSSTFFG
jgi:hypothetical protein